MSPGFQDSVRNYDVQHRNRLIRASISANTFLETATSRSTWRLSTGAVWNVEKRLLRTIFALTCIGFPSKFHLPDDI